MIRSLQAGRGRKRYETGAIVAAYYSNVRSVLEYCSVVWSGAARTHTDRIERIQHKFLIWLTVHAKTNSESLIQWLTFGTFVRLSGCQTFTVWPSFSGLSLQTPNWFYFTAIQVWPGRPSSISSTPGLVRGSLRRSRNPQERPVLQDAKTDEWLFTTECSDWCF